MPAKASKILIVGLFAVILSAAAFSNIYFVRDDAGGSIFSKGNEAYLFLGSGHTGYHFRAVEYPLVLLKGYFYAPPFPSDQVVSTTVIRLTASSAEQFTDNVKNDSPSLMYFTPSSDGFYVMCGVDLCKWTEAGFRRATDDQERKFGGIDHLFKGDANNKVINGWFVRELRRSPGDHFRVDVGGKFTIEGSNHATSAQEYPRMSIDLLRPGQPREELYNVDGAPHRVSAAEYKRDFPPGSALKE